MQISDAKPGEYLHFVVIAYALAFLPWTALAAHDFISPSWKSVKDTRRGGLIHLSIVALPMFYIPFYIYLQARDRNFHEMCSAAVAWVFSLLHLVRTLWGLWQLHLFREWSVDAIHCLRSLGYEYGPGRGEKKDVGKSPSFFPVSLGISSRKRERLYSLADEILVNDSIVDNRLLGSETRCYLRWELGRSSGEQEMHVVQGQRFWSFLAPQVVCRILWRYFLLFCAAIARNVLRVRCTYGEGSTIPVLKQTPIQAEEVWMRWAVVFISQGAEKWVKDCDMVTKLSELDLFKMPHDTIRDYFAGSVLAAAMLQVSSVRSEHLLPNERNNTNEQSAVWEARLGIPPENWAKFECLSSGVFSRAEILYSALKEGRGLPFDAPHDIALKDRGYSSLKFKLEHTTQSLPASFGKSIRELDVNKLEWFAILLYIGEWSSKEREEEVCERITVRKKNMDDDHRELEEDVAVFALRRQLGFKSDDDIDLRRRCAFPAFAVDFGKPFLGNRCVLELSGYIDSWLALCVGQQTQHVLQLSESKRAPTAILSERCDIAAQEEKQEKENGEVQAEEVSNIFDKRKAAGNPLHVWEKLEEERMAEQLAVKSEYFYLEQSLTFLGCTIESVRSMLAEFVQKSGRLTREQWHPKISFRKDDKCRAAYEALSFEMCSELKRGLGFEGRKFFSYRFAQARLLFETQKHLYNIVSCGNVSPDQVPLMLLCLLGFPSITCTLKEKSKVDHSLSEQHCECCVAVNLGGGSHEDILVVDNIDIHFCPTRGADDLYVECSLRKSKVYVSLMRNNESENTYFEWEKWRDIYGGRMSGSRKWQEAHLMDTVSLITTGEPIYEGVIEVDLGPQEPTTTGPTLVSWKGWPPFRASICRFEMQSDSFLLEEISGKYSPKIISKQDYSFDVWIPERKLKPCEYAEAERYALGKASMILRTSFRKALFEDAVERIRSEDVRADLSTDFRKNAEQLLQQRSVTGLELKRVLQAYYNSQEHKSSLESMEMAVRLCEQSNMPDRLRQTLDIIMEFSASLLSKLLTARGTQVAEIANVLSKVLDLHLSAAQRSDFRAPKTIEETMWIYLHAYRECAEKSLATARFGRKLLELLTVYVQRCRTKFIRTGGNIAVLKDADYSSLSEHDSDDIVCVLGCYFWEILNRGAFCVRVLGNAIHSNDNRSTARDVVLYTKRTSQPLHTLALVNMKGAEDMRQNFPRAIELFQCAIDEGGSVNSMFELALVLLQGVEGVERNVSRAVLLLKRAINEGNHVPSMSQLALLLLDGNGIEKNAKSAAALFQRAIDEGGYVDSMHELAKLLLRGEEGVEKCPSRAVGLLERAIDEGSLELSMHLLAKLLYTGAEGVEKNTPRAISLLERAIDEKGYIPSMHELGVLLVRGGDGLEKNASRAAALFQKAIDEGSFEISMKWLAWLLMAGAENVEKDCPRAVALLERLINDGGHVYAMHELAVLLCKGDEGVEKNYLRAKELFERAIDEGGYVSSMHELAFLHMRGAEGIELDILRAASLFERAIDEGGHIVSMHQLAILHLQGLGVEKNTLRAAELFERSIDEGSFIPSLHELGVLLVKGGDGLERNASRAASLFQRAIDEGKSAPSMHELAVLLLDGAEDVDKNPSHAKELFERAIDEASFVASLHELALLLIQGAEGVEQDVLRAASLFERAIDEGGLVDSMHELAVLLLKGDNGIEKNISRAAALFERAIDEGNCVDSMYELANLISKGGEGVQKDELRASALRQRAATER